MLGNAGPATDAAAITPSDTKDLPKSPCVAIFVGTTGNVAIITATGNTVTFKNLPSGQPLDVAATRVLATGTTATDLVALY